MAPFIIKHPKLINQWMTHYTETLNKILNQEIDKNLFSKYIKLLKKALSYLQEVTTTDDYQIKKNNLSIIDLKKYIVYCINIKNTQNLKWNKIIDYCDINFNFDTQEIARVQLIELYPQISENLAEDMADDEVMEVNGNQKIKEFKKIINKNYNWIKEINFENKDSNFLFWYISAAKLEPRLGERFSEEGSDLEQNLGVAKMVHNLLKDINNILY